MRVKFENIFKNNGDGTYAPHFDVHIGGVSLCPKVTLGPGQSFSGFDVKTHAGKDLEVIHLTDESFEIISFYF